MTTKTITLSARPKGPVTRENFGLEQRADPVLSAGKLITRPLYLSVDPYMRGRMNDAKSYIAPFALGEPIESAGIARVVAVNSGSKFHVGDLVSGMMPWQELALVDEKAVRAASAELPLGAQLGALGMPGLTAYVGLFDIGQAKPGETVFVSAAAGAVGSVVGQLAKIHGCYVVGSAGSDDKVRYLKEELGFDAAFNYKTVDNQRSALREACPKGIDVYFDNVGGATLEAALFVCNVHARIPICGMISGYETASPEPGPSNLAILIQKRIRMEGFLVSDHSARMGKFASDAARWLAEGKLKVQETVVDGFENAPAAFIGLLRGDNVGKMLVRVSES
jgi:NADPH:quinone reductase